MDFELIKKKKWLLIILLAVLLIGVVALIYLTKHKKATSSETGQGYEVPLYTVVQDGKAKVVAYDFTTKKHYVVMSTVVTEETSFKADYSAIKNSIVYSDAKGISSYDLKEKTTALILENVVSANTEIDGPHQIYSSPEWSYDGKKITYNMSGVEWASRFIMDADGKNSQKLEHSGDFTWSKDSYDYFMTSFDQMGGDCGIYTNLSDPITKTKSIFEPDKTIASLSSPQIINDQSLFFMSRKATKDTKGNQISGAPIISSISRDGGEITNLYEDKELFGKFIFDGQDKIFFAKATTENNIDKGLGIFEIGVDGKNPSLFYKDGDNVVTVLDANENFVTVLSSPKMYWETGTIGKIMTIGRRDKTAYELVNASTIGFAGWINTEMIPKDAEVISEPTPTKAEQDAYELSLKTKGSLYGNYYEYCWDYDCTSETYPYPKLKTSLKPEVITFESQSKLTGNVVVPLVFLEFNDAPIPLEQLTVLKDNSVDNSIASSAKWLNDQAESDQQSLNFSFDYKSEVVSLPSDGSCSEISGTTTQLSWKCVSEKIFEKYPALKNEKYISVSFGKSMNPDLVAPSIYNGSLTGQTYFQIFNSFYIDGYLWDQNLMHGTYPILATDKFKENVVSGNNTGSSAYFFADFLSHYGARSRIATYKKPMNNDVDACFAGSRLDIMCRQYIEAGAVKYLYKLSELKIGEITKKELGWYDADGDKINEVDDRCPFDKANTCK